MAGESPHGLDFSSSSATSQVLLHRVQTALAELRQFLDRLGWTEESLKSSQNMEMCTEDRGHIVPAKVHARHVRRCKLRRRGYSNDELEEMRESSRFYYADCTNIVRVKFDQKLQDEVLRHARADGKSFCDDPTIRRDSMVAPPVRTSLSVAPPAGSSLLVAPPVRTDLSVAPPLSLTARRAVSDLGVAERAVLYDYVVRVAQEERSRRNIVENGIPPADMSEVPADSSFVDLVGRQKPSLKRHRKTLGTPRKSHTETLREIISDRMSVLAFHHEAEAN